MAFNFKPRPLALVRADKRKLRTKFESDNKAEARKRDAKACRTGCRWPRCEHCHLRIRKEVAHYKSKGMGGDHGRRSGRHQLITFCHLIHQGPDSIHSGDRTVKVLTDDGTDGPCEFYHDGILVAREIAPGVLERAL